MTRFLCWLATPFVALVDALGRRVDDALHDEEDQW